MSRRHLLGAGVLLAGGVAAACGTGESAGEIRLAYQRSTDAENRVIDAFLGKVSHAYERAHPGQHVTLVPIEASENDYYTKVALMMRSSRTAPDIVYEDTFRIAADVAAGYLRPLDRQIARWPAWTKFSPHPKTAVSARGHVYGVPNNTDTRALWYNRRLFRKAGLPLPWHPRNWADILSAAHTIKKKLPGVTPINVYTGRGGGEQSSMQGFEMLLYGTRNRLYIPRSGKWVVNSPGFRDSLEFVKTVYAEGLGPDPSTALDPNISTTVTTSLLPADKLAIDLDGSWLNSNWASGGPSPWPDWSKVLGTTTMPTQHGQPPGSITLSGGWAWSIPSNAVHPEIAFELIKALSTEKNMLTFNLATANITVRRDVADDPKYLHSAPTTKFFTDLLARTEYRPSQAAYPQVSNAIQQAMEQVTTGGSVTDAVDYYDGAVRDAVGSHAVVSGNESG